MTDRVKFEQMLEYLINEDKAKAEELFHELVVAKSREIYETLLDDDIEIDEADDKEGDEDSDDDEQQNEDFDIDEIGGDPADDMMGSLEAGDDEGDEEMPMGGEGGDEPATKDDVMDIKDALQDLRAEFEAMLAGEGEEDAGDEEGEEDAGDEEGEEDAGDEEGENPFAKEGVVREYVEKVSAAKMGDNGANTKSIVAKPNNMGGTTANIAKGGESSSGGTKGGLLNPSTKEDNAGNVNVPGGKAGVKHLGNVKAPAGGDDGANKKSTIGS